MTLWFVIVIIVLAVSFFLAMRSMSNYQYTPKTSSRSSSLFLIQAENVLTAEIMDQLYGQLRATEIISLERLFKGSKRALVIYGPEEVIKQFLNTLQPLELEDYTSLSVQTGLTQFAWVLTAKQGGGNKFDTTSISMPDLNTNEQIWFQIVTQKRSDVHQNAILRLVVSCEENRKTLLMDEVVKIINQAGIIRVPTALSHETVMTHFKDRAMPNNNGVTGLSKEGILKLLWK